MEGNSSRTEESRQRRNMTAHSSLGTIFEHGDLEDGDDDSSFCSGIRNIRIILQQEEESARQEREQSMKVRQSSLRVKTTSTRKKYWAWRLSRRERQWEKNTRVRVSNKTYIYASFFMNHAL